jgi:hypothetical protein
MARNSTNDWTKVPNLDDATQNRELTEAEMNAVAGGVAAVIALVAQIDGKSKND